MTKADNSIEIYPPTSQKNNVQFVWRWGKDKAATELNKEIIGYFNEDGEYRIVQKMRTSEKLIRSLIDGKEYTSRRGTAEVEAIFHKKVGSFPKPVSLIQLFAKAGIVSNDIILDCFSGTCTMAHAILDLNMMDQGNRKFICVQLPEKTYEIKDGKEVAKKESAEAFKAGFKTIADIGKERIRKVIKKLNEEQAGKLDLGGASAQDRGFKVLKLDKSNFKQWQKLAPDATPEQIEKQLSLHIDHIDHAATPEDLLFEILIKAGFMPTEKVQTINLAGIPVFSIADGGLLICLADTITKELINAVAEAEPMQFICLDKAFGGNDQLKANAVQTFNARNMGREKVNQIIFRTV